MKDLNRLLWQAKPVKFRHGGAYERGTADFHYGRKFEPHYYAGAPYYSAKIVVEQGSVEYADYAAGYAYQQKAVDLMN